MLDDVNGPIMKDGRDVNVIAQKVAVPKDMTTTLFIFLLVLGSVTLIIIGAILKGYFYALIAIGVIIPIWIFSVIKKDESYFLQLEQRVQQSASQIDNYLEQRAMVLKNTAQLVNKAVNLDKDIFVKVAELRSGNDLDRNEVQKELNLASKNINVAFENYPDIKSHAEIRDAIEQNMYLQREITAAREVYNDNIGIWNREIFEWPFKKYVAAKQNYTTRIPFVASQDIKQEARGTFF